MHECVYSVYDVFENCSPAEYVAAIVMEPLQGEGGFIPAPIEFVKAVRKICDENGILLIADEVQSGFGRTGKLFASEYWKENGCAPDIIATAKSIAGGVPLSAVIASKEVMDAVPGGTIGGTYGGNALACAAGLEVLEDKRTKPRICWQVHSGMCKEWFISRKCRYLWQRNSFPCSTCNYRRTA